MANYNKISADAFNNFQINAGMILKTFNPASIATPSDSDIICATTGGITVSAIPTFKDFGEDVDNCPNNLMELKKIESWECKLAFTALDVTAASIQLALGASDLSSNKITPRKELDDDDFADIWWVGERVDGATVAVKLINALSTGGFSLKTEKDGKGNLTVELTGHTSIESQSVVPIECYVIAAA